MHTPETIRTAALECQDIEDLAMAKRFAEHTGRQMAGRDRVLYRRRQLIDLRPAATALGLALLAGYAGGLRDE